MVIHVHILPDMMQNTVGVSKLSIKSFELQKRSVSLSPTRIMIAVCMEMVCVWKQAIKIGHIVMYIYAHMHTLTHIHTNI